MKIKMFVEGDPVFRRKKDYGDNLDKNVFSIGERVNKWLKENQEMRIFTVNQSVSGNTVIISVWYFDETKEDPKRLKGEK